MMIRQCAKSHSLFHRLTVAARRRSRLQVESIGERKSPRLIGPAPFAIHSEKGEPKRSVTRSRRHHQTFLTANDNRLRKAKRPDLQHLPVIKAQRVSFANRLGQFGILEQHCPPRSSTESIPKSLRVLIRGSCRRLAVNLSA